MRSGSSAAITRRRHPGQSRLQGQRGFTLLELMTVVAIIAVLAAVAIPSWTRESRRGKFDPEVRAMFAEIGLKQEQYKSEAGNGVYSALPLCPATTSPKGVDVLAASCYSGAWTTLRIAPTDSAIRCTYVVTTGTGVPTVPVGFTAPANSATMAGPWYQVVGTCDMDNSGGTNTTFFAASWDQKIQKQNYGS